jgi:hypothetical protein
MTALQILESARVLIGNEASWNAHEAERAKRKAATYGDDLEPVLVWALNEAGRGEMEQKIKAFATVRMEAGCPLVKWKGGWKDGVELVERAMKRLMA